MTNEELKVLEAEFLELMKRHKVENATMCGNIPDGEREGEFIACPSGRDNITAYVMAIANVGRLWQSMRNSMKKFLDSFEKSE